MSQSTTVSNFLLSLMNAPDRDPSLSGKSSEIKEITSNRRARTGCLAGFHLNDIVSAAAEIKNGYNTNNSEINGVLSQLDGLSTRVIHSTDDDDPFFV